MKYEEEKNIIATVSEWKRLRRLLVRYSKLECIDKVATVATLFIVGGIGIGLGTCVVMCICFGLVGMLKDYYGESGSFFIMGGSLTLIIIVFALARKVLFTNPIVRELISRLFPNSTSDISQKKGE